VESEWIGVFSEWLFHLLKNHSESVQTPHKFTWTLGLCSDKSKSKSKHFLVDSD
jgi:hypothetical protein